ncbi:MAG: hypothetical protein ACI4QA_03815 [Candidatus Spyradosoma sp.]
MTLEEKAEIAFREAEKMFPADGLLGVKHIGKLGDEDFFDAEINFELVADFEAISISEDGRLRFIAMFDFWDVEAQKGFTKHERVFLFGGEKR